MVCCWDSPKLLQALLVACKQRLVGHACRRLSQRDVR